MVSQKRTARLNSLLKEVISEVIHQDVRNPKVGSFVSITRVDISRDLHLAKVFISVLADKAGQQDTLRALQSAAKFISFTASKKVVLRHFPKLIFRLDNSTEQFLKIDELLQKIHLEEKAQNS